MTELQYAGFWRRAAALVVDGLLATPIYIALGFVFAGYGRDVVLTVLMLAAYTWFFASAWQGTPGMKLLKVKAVDDAGSRLSHGRALLWCVANGAALAIIMGGMIYLQVTYDFDAVTAKVQSGDMAGAQELLGMSFVAFYGYTLAAFAVFAVLAIIWALTIALGRQKAGLVNRLCGVRFVR